MNATAIDYCNTGKDIVISRRVIVKFIYMMVYLCIYVINYKRINEYFNKKEEEKEVEVEEEEEEEDIYDFEGTGEQLRRLRANNQKNDSETHDEYESRIWNMAYKEDAEEERKKLLNKAEGENAPVEQFRVALKDLRQEWNAKWQRDQVVKGEI